jgi:hypothetical protein
MSPLMAILSASSKNALRAEMKLPLIALIEHRDMNKVENPLKVFRT